MSDTVKLIIEIDKRAYKACQELRTNNDNGITGLCAVNAIANGTPLDDVKAEIDNEWANTHHMYPDYASGLAWASEIIDKHIGKAESEDKE